MAPAHWMLPLCTNVTWQVDPAPEQCPIPEESKLEPQNAAQATEPWIILVPQH